MRHEHSALEFAYHFVSNTAVLLCSYSEPSERAAACFVPPAVCSCVCVHRAIPCILPSSVHVIIICTQIRHSGNPLVTFFSRVSLFLPFHFFAVPLDVPATSKCIQLNSTYEDGVAFAVPMSTYEGCCCTYDLQDSPSWLLLLLIVDQLVYRAVSLLCRIYHPAG